MCGGGDTLTQIDALWFRVRYRTQPNPVGRLHIGAAERLD